MKIELASILENELIARNIWKMKMTAPGVAEQYKGAGQFIQILVDSSWANPLRRPMSISAVEDGKIEIIYKVFGEMTQLLSEKDAGENLDILGPLGNTFKLHDDGSTPILVGGGVGLTHVSGVAVHGGEAALLSGPAVSTCSSVRPIALP